MNVFFIELRAFKKRFHYFGLRDFSVHDIAPLFPFKNRRSACGLRFILREKRIYQALHPRFFSRSGVFLYNAFPSRGIYLFDHNGKRLFRLAFILARNRSDYFLCRTADSGFYFSILNPALFVLLMSLFG
jgi:hypothetical protein